MINAISNIPDGIRSGLNRIPQSPNRAVNAVRALVVLAILAPGSCVGVGAAVSGLYNTLSSSSDKDKAPKKESAEDAVLPQEWETDPFVYESAWSCDEK